MTTALAAEQAYARAVLRDTLLTPAEHDAVVDATPRGAPLRPGQDRPNGPRTLDEHDVRVDVTTSGPARTVRLTHIPTGAVETADASRGVHTERQARELAWHALSVRVLGHLDPAPPQWYRAAAVTVSAEMLA